MQEEVSTMAERPQAEEPAPVPYASRRPELDLMRAFVVAGLVVFHSAMVFASGSSWFINDPRPSPGFTVFLLWGSLWGMPLLFLVSGMGARYALRSRSAGAFLRERLGRLGVPLLTGLVLLVAPMFYLSRVGEPGFHEPYWRFWLRFLNPAAIAIGIPARGTWRSGGDEFDPAHLWFLFSLLVFSIVLLPAFGYLRRPHGAGLIERLAGLSERHPAPALLLAAVPIMAVEAALGPDKNTGGWERLTYVVFFLYGYLLASDRRFEQTLRRLRWWALGSAVSASVLLAVAAKILDPSAGDVVSGVSPPVSAAQALAGWMWTAAILGFAGTVAARLATTGAGGSPAGSATSAPRWRRVARYGNEAVLPFYVLHEPVIVAVAWVVVRWSAPLPVKYLSVVAASFVLTLALYEGLVRRFQLTRFLFGMKPARPTGPIAHQTTPTSAAAAASPTQEPDPGWAGPVTPPGGTRA
jgi:glucan biosynthesis protein C